MVMLRMVMAMEGQATARREKTTWKRVLQDRKEEHLPLPSLQFHQPIKQSEVNKVQVVSLGNPVQRFHELRKPLKVMIRHLKCSMQ
jgi:hypothetical protein